MVSNIISYGGGQNSTAMIIEMKKRGLIIDEVLFADVGNEMPETYEFLKVFKEWCAKQGIIFTIVKSHLGTLRDDNFNKKIIPYRAFRSCTDKFKIQPIKKYIKQKYGSYKAVNMFLGIDYGEQHRAKEDDTYNSTQYPLIEWCIDRKGCQEIISKAGLPIPVKSGCYFCPFQTKKVWLELLEQHPELYEDSIVFEENGRGFPEHGFTDISLRKLKHIKKTQKSLIDFEPRKVEKCIYCQI